MVMVCGFAGLLHANRKEVGKTERHRLHGAGPLDEVHSCPLGAGELQAAILGSVQFLAGERVDSTMRHHNVQFPDLFSFHFVSLVESRVCDSPCHCGQATTQADGTLALVGYSQSMQRDAGFMVHGSWFTLQVAFATWLLAKGQRVDAASDRGQFRFAVFLRERGEFRLRFLLDILRSGGLLLCFALDAVGEQELADVLLAVTIGAERGDDGINLDCFAVLADELLQLVALCVGTLGQRLNFVDLSCNSVIDAVSRVCHAVVDADGDVGLFHFVFSF